MIVIPKEEHKAADSRTKNAILRNINGNKIPTNTTAGKKTPAEIRRPPAAVLVGFSEMAITLFIPLADM